LRWWITRATSTIYNLKPSIIILDERTLHNGGGKRNGSFAIYLEPWHSDELFLQMQEPRRRGVEGERPVLFAVDARFFMSASSPAGMDSNVSPRMPGLSDVYGDEFKQLYESYETGKAKAMNARDLCGSRRPDGDGDAVYRLCRTPPTRSPTRKRRHDQVQ
jgi:ribonucleoside-diphosphate reductase subunit M1